jgi:hypothetical protein
MPRAAGPFWLPAHVLPLRATGEKSGAKPLIEHPVASVERELHMPDRHSSMRF